MKFIVVMNNTFLKAFLSFVAIFCIGCSSKENPEWQQLFNGENLDNWNVKIRGFDLGDNFGNTFRVEDGNLQVRYDQYENGFQEKFGHLFYKDSFSSYLLAVEYRFVGDQVSNNPGSWAFRNNGVMVHGQDPATMEKDQDFPTSIEVQLLGGNETGERSTANLCTPGTHVVIDGELVKTHCIESSSKTFHGDQWVRVEVLVLRDSLIAHYIDGQEVMRYEKPQTDDGQILKKGSISVQSESHPTDFRKIEIVDLEPYVDEPARLQKILNDLKFKGELKSN
ncbi:DUF1080 domain-containing protein [Antarcticibacterium sp. 1MA-6-2]|uniref:3-keto-disaccharide hydrolase n=1 Tax=Antarcticibacterium sp. 1MA-6-2 TaxID=2908210 RepID=UPI001F24DC09|nr:DUF1080 domain-containing protein [Antarcticibacterium sp. 1MA-6-2]UJH90426.1 DUF1080 domain-containing protein [Antarcticibacterium sp. 1MA-6-2]